MKIYYKCRWCGQIFDDKFPDDDTADLLIAIKLLHRSVHEPALMTTHRCKGGTPRVGIADAIGIARE